MLQSVDKIRWRKGQLWSYFSVLDANEKKAECNYCKKTLSYKTTISNLRHHLKRKHFIVFQELSNDDNNDEQNEYSEPLLKVYNAAPSSDAASPASDAGQDDEESKFSPIKVYNAESSSIDAASHFVPSQDDEQIEYSDPLLKGYAVLSPVKGPTNFGPSRDASWNRRRHFLKSMRQTSLKMPHEQVAKEVAVAESQRLKLEDDRERRQHEIELRRLELDTLRENNLHAREAARAQIDRDTIKIQQEFLALLNKAIDKFSVKQ